MALPYISVEDCFPVIRQTILDTYKVDSFLMHYPYSDLERLDMGLRKMVWGTYSTNSAIFSLSPEQDAWQIIVLKSVLGFYNLIITVTNEEHPDMFGFMPFRTEPATPAVINRIMKENGIPPQYTSSMQQVYYNLPVVEMQSLITTLQHLITAFIPGFAANHVEYINYTSEQHEVDFNEERIHKLGAEHFPVAVGPSFGHATKYELKNKGFETPAILADAGCEVSIITDSPVIEERYLPLCAGRAIYNGMREFDALRAITIQAARHIGAEDRVGSIEEGKDADFVLLKGTPFSIDARILYTIINGEIVYQSGE